MSEATVASLPMQFGASVPGNVDDALLAGSGLVTASVRALAAIALRDQALTYREYLSTAKAAENLAATSDNKLLVRVLFLKTMSDPGSVEDALAKLAEQVSKSDGAAWSEEARRTVFLAATPILECQGSDSRGIADALGSALRINGETIKTVVGGLPDKSKTSMFGFFSGLWAKQPSQWEAQLARAKHTAEVLDDQALRGTLDRVAEYPGGDRANVLQRAVRDAVQRSVDAVRAHRPGDAELARQKIAAERFLVVARALVDQLRQRLQSIEDRIAWQRAAFNTDVDSFVVKSAALVENQMRDFVRGEDWTNDEAWKKFAEGDGAATLQREFRELRAKYDALSGMWTKEIERFTGEMRETALAVFSSVDEDVFASLIPLQHRRADAAKAADEAADGVLATAAAVAAVGGTALITGAGSVGAVLLAGASSPVVIGAVAVAGAGLGLAALWKYWADPEERKVVIVKEKSQALREGLLSLLQTPRDEHDRHLDEIRTAFIDCATRYYPPMLRDALLAIEIPRLEHAVLTRIETDTVRLLEPSP